jgi:hypothetical protein
MLTVADANITINEGDTRRLQFCEVPKHWQGGISAAGMSTPLISVFAVRGERSPYRTGAKIQYFAQTLVRTAR